MFVLVYLVSNPLIASENDSILVMVTPCPDFIPNLAWFRFVMQVWGTLTSITCIFSLSRDSCFCIVEISSPFCLKTPARPLFNFIARAISCLSSSLNTTKYPWTVSCLLIRLQLFFMYFFVFDKRTYILFFIKININHDKKCLLFLLKDLQFSS